MESANCRKESDSRRWRVRQGVRVPLVKRVRVSSRRQEGRRRHNRLAVHFRGRPLQTSYSWPTRHVACNSRVFVNGSPIADVATGEKVVFYLPEGEHMLAARAEGICIGGLVEAKAAVSRNKPSVFRISYGSSGEFALQPTAFRVERMSSLSTKSTLRTRWQAARGASHEPHGRAGACQWIKPLS